MSKIVTANISPIKVKDLKNLFTLQVPLIYPEIHCPQVDSSSGIVGQKTLDHAFECAQRIIDSMETLPHTEQAGDLLAMAYAIKHYKENKDV